MEKAFFILDTLGSQQFEASTYGELWNGFDCPYFTLKGAMQLLDAWWVNGWDARYDEAVDAFVFSVGHDSETG